MKIRPLSDLHLEFTGYEIDYLPPVGEDLVVLAGDIGLGCGGIDWAIRAIPDRPVVYVLGNHEFYRQDFDDLLVEARARCAGTQVSVLENDSLRIGRYRVLGCTLWTDFRALGEQHRAASMQLAEEAMNDYSLIRVGSRVLRAEDTERRCLASLLWLHRELQSETTPTVVVTHHPPTLATQHPRFAGRAGAPLFHNDFDALIAPPVVAWIHGHTHHGATADVNGIPVTSNQRGYPREVVAGFDWNSLLALAD